MPKHLLFPKKSLSFKRNILSLVMGGVGGHSEQSEQIDMWGSHSEQSKQIDVWGSHSEQSKQIDMWGSYKPKAQID